MELNQVFQNVLKLLSVSLNSENTHYLPDLTCWNEIKTELEAQTVLPVASDYLLKSDLSDSDKLDVLKRTAINVKGFHLLMKAQTELFELLKKNGIKAAVLKGAGAAQYYPRPELRQFGDIDVLVLPKDFDKAFYLMKKSGYKNIDELDSNYQRHLAFKTSDGKTKIELHRFFSSSFNAKQNSLLDGWLYSQIPSVQEAVVGTYTVPVLPALENGLVILGHINQHLSAGLGLRQIIDWMFYVKANLTDLFWETDFREKAKAIGMDYLAKIVTKMCQMYLGLTKEITWCNDADENLATELMDYINKKANFGKKDNKESLHTRGRIKYYFAKPQYIFYRLTKIGMIHMQEDGLKPRKAYAWLYQIIHLFKELFRGKGNDNLLSEMKASKEEVDFLKQFKLTNL